eukprot:CCRYP_014152-RA/>CCRYP_014152-RA protein AED:0.26 eAED:0.26 QI:897/1/1/1/0.88/0.8/10/620/1334
MDNSKDAPPRPPPPPPARSVPSLSPPGNRSGASSRPPPSRPPRMQRNSTTGSAVPSGRENDSDSNDAPPVSRVRTFSASSTRDLLSNTASRAPPRRNNLAHYRSSSSRAIRIDNDTYDPLLMASLERPAPEHEAETTLLDVLERRQVTFVNPDSGTSSAAAPMHRRHRTYAGTLPNEEIYSPSVYGIDAQRPNSAPSSSNVPRPGLISRAASLKSRRNILQDSSTTNTMGNTLGEYLGVDGNGTVLPKECSGDGSVLSKSVSSESSAACRNTPAGSAHTNNGSPARRQHPAKLSNHWNLIRQPDFFSRTRRISWESTEVSESSASVRDRAFQVAMSFKNNDNSTGYISSLGERNEGELSDLLNRVEAIRENDESSRGSGTRNSKGSIDQIQSHRDSWSKSTGSHDRDPFNSSIGGSSGFSSSRRGHTRGPGHHQLQHTFMGISTPLGGDFGGQSNIDMMFQVAEHVQELCQIPEEDETEDFTSSVRAGGSVRSHTSSVRSQALASENANFLQQISASHPDIPDITDELDAEEANEQTPMLDKAQSRQSLAYKVKQAIHHKGKLRTVNLWISILRRQLKILWAAFDLAFVREKLWGFIQYQLSCVIIPLLAIATFFFYRLGNPSLAFLPTDASVSWWILFAVRSYLTLQLAYVTEYLFVDVLAMRSPMSVQMIGPLATLYTINAKGWPFLLTCWGIWNFLLVHGNNLFYEHWLWFSDIEMLNPSNKADGIVDSDTYTDILLSMIFAGVATSIKRTVLALYLGKRVYIHYKPKLEKVMIDMLLLTEVAELASALHEFQVEKVDSPLAVARNIPSSRFISNKNSFHANTMVEFVKSNQDSSEDEGDQREGQDRPEPIKSWNRLRSMSNSDMDDDDDMNSSAEKVLATQQTEAALTTKLSVGSDLSGKATKTSIGSDLSGKGSDLFGTGIENGNENSPDVNNQNDSLAVASDTAPKLDYDTQAEAFPVDTTDQALDKSEVPVDTIHEPVRGILHQGSTTFQIKGLLDRWEEPVNKLDKGSDPTIHEILQFRKALSFLDDEHPFGLSFGPAFTRDSCIKSSRELYTSLLAFDTDSPVLHFDVIGVLAYDSDGNFDERKAKGLVRLFRPDRFDEVTLLAFVQSCDGVYKRLRYLRASVGNSTSIDRVLENIFNGIFNFFLFLAVLSIMKLNPWALLVSMSTVLVSFAFALGPSAAKIIEGMMMIAVRRPFDLGDRISISGPNEKSGDDDPGYIDAWLVEDCNLFTTTLRLARTNEISYLNNGTLSNCKIVNHGRSNNALVNLVIRMRLEASHEQVQIVRSSLDQYIRDNPRVWSCLILEHVSRSTRSTLGKHDVCQFEFL